MKDFAYKLIKLGWRFLHFPREIENDFFRRGGVQIGSRCRINSNILTAESYMISIGDDVTIADNVSFVTHDNSISKVIPGSGNLFGKIRIGDKCFIGSHSVIMYGVELASEVIVASGSVITKSFNESRIIIGGNPAKKISTWESFAEKHGNDGIKVASLSTDKKKELLLSENVKLIKR